MFSSWKVGRPFGIPFYIHWTFWLLPLWVVLANLDKGPVELGLILCVLVAGFGCVLLHELGHALTARYYGIRTRDISLYPIGGVARLERSAERPIQELWITVAGPAVNFVIAVLLLVVLLGLALLDPGLVFGSLPGLFLLQLLAVNVIMVVFNLLPAFPMDGGRVLRSLLAMGLGNLRATRIAVTVGVITVALVAAGGVYYFHNPWLMVIALFVFLAGQAELQMAYVRERRRRVEEVEEPLPVLPVRPVRPVRPVGEPVGEAAPLFSLQPRITVYTWDNDTGTWVRQTRDGTSRAL
jgi:Zn-dependent protease